MKRTYIALVLALLMVLSLLAGCGAKNYAADSNGYPMEAPEMDYVEDGMKESLSDSALGGGSNAAGSTPINQKIIRTMEIHAETEDLDALLASVEEKVRELGGYVEQKEVYRGSAYAQKVYRNGRMTVRVPAAEADLFISRVGEVSNVTSFHEDTDDVTLQYVATESRITALETEQARLLELLEKAESMEDLLKIESRLTDVRTELEQVTSQLRVYDNLVNYATIHLRMEEVREYTPVEEKTFWQKISSGLKENCQDLAEAGKNFVIFLVTSLPYLLLIGVVVVVFILALRAGKRRRANRRARQQTQQQDDAQ